MRHQARLTRAVTQAPPDLLMPWPAVVAPGGSLSPTAPPRAARPAADAWLVSATLRVLQPGVSRHVASSGSLSLVLNCQSLGGAENAV